MREIIHLFSELCTPTEKQRAFLEAVEKYKYVLYGGAKSGGKSRILRWALLKLLCKWAKEGHRGVRVGLFCEDYPSLKDRQITKIQSEFPLWLGTLSDNQIQGMSFILKPEFGGGVLALRNLDDASKYASSEFAAIAVDELTKNPQEVFDQLRSILRWPGIENVKFIAGTNPIGIGLAWVKKLWIDRMFDEGEPEKEKFHFIQALAKDNPYISAVYLRQLESLPEKLRKAYLEGDWDIFEGQYFEGWNRDHHVVTPFQIPKEWTKFRCIDYGYKNPSAVYWAAISKEGKVYLYREFYGTGYTYKMLAQKIRAMTPDEEEKEIEYTVADTSMFAASPDTGEYGNTIFDTEGVPLIQANKERIPGWQLLRQYLKDDMIVVFSSCVHFIRTFPSLIHSQIYPEDVDKKGEAHAADAVRYLLMSLPQAPSQEEMKELPYKDDPDSPWYHGGKVGYSQNQIYSLR